MKKELSIFVMLMLIITVCMQSSAYAGKKTLPHIIDKQKMVTETYQEIDAVQKIIADKDRAVINSGTFKVKSDGDVEFVERTDSLEITAGKIFVVPQLIANQIAVNHPDYKWEIEPDTEYDEYLLMMAMAGINFDQIKTARDDYKLLTAYIAEAMQQLGIEPTE